MIRKYVQVSVILFFFLNIAFRVPFLKKHRCTHQSLTYHYSLHFSPSLLYYYHILLYRYIFLETKLAPLRMPFIENVLNLSKMCRGQDPLFTSEGPRWRRERIRIWEQGIGDEDRGSVSIANQVGINIDL